MSDRLNEAKVTQPTDPANLYQSAYEGGNQLTKSKSEQGANKVGTSGSGQVDFSVGDPFKGRQDGPDKDVSARKSEGEQKKPDELPKDAPVDKPKTPSDAAVNPPQSDEDYRGRKPEDDYKQHSTYEKDRTVVVRTGDKPQNNFTLTLNNDGTWSQEFKDGRKLEGRRNPDGSEHVKSTGDTPDKNFESDRSADGRTVTVRFADGRVVTQKRDDRGNMQSVDSTGPDSRDNFTIDAKGKVTHKSWTGAALDPMNIHAQTTSNDASFGALDSLRSSTEATLARTRRIYKFMYR